MVLNWFLSVAEHLPVRASPIVRALYAWTTRQLATYWQCPLRESLASLPLLPLLTSIVAPTARLLLCKGTKHLSQEERHQTSVNPVFLGEIYAS